MGPPALLLASQKAVDDYGLQRHSPHSQGNLGRGRSLALPGGSHSGGQKAVGKAEDGVLLILIYLRTTKPLPPQ